MIEFHLDGGSGLSPYQQIVRQVRHALRLGLLNEGDQLPTVKDVVAALAINPNTVLKAYRELEHEGLVAGRPGVGTFVTRSLADESLPAHKALQADLARRVASSVSSAPTAPASRRCSTSSSASSSRARDRSPCSARGPARAPTTWH